MSTVSPVTGVGHLLLRRLGSAEKEQHGETHSDSFSPVWREARMRRALFARRTFHTSLRGGSLLVLLKMFHGP